MKNKLKKIAFPFYSSERHSFLMEKWWFRLLFVLYIIGMIVSPIVFALITNNWLVEPCSDLLIGDELAKLHNNNPDLPTDYLEDALKDSSEDYMNCRRSMKDEVRLYVWFGPIVTHYLIQFALFKIVINFIMLGGKK